MDIRVLYNLIYAPWCVSDWCLLLGCCCVLCSGKVGCLVWCWWCFNRLVLSTSTHIYVLPGKWEEWCFDAWCCWRTLGVYPIRMWWSELGFVLINERDFGWLWLCVAKGFYMPITGEECEQTQIGTYDAGWRKWNSNGFGWHKRVYL